MSDAERTPRPLAVVDLQIVPGKADEWWQLAQELVRDTRAEPGCVRYEFLRDLQDPHRLTLLEQFEDMPAVMAHLERLKERYGEAAGGDPHAAPEALTRYWASVGMRRVETL